MNKLEFQRCPVCNGHGLVQYPDGIADGQSFGSTSTGPWPCRRCNGTGTIERPKDTDLL